MSIPPAPAAEPPPRAPLRMLAGLAWRESRSARRKLLLYMSSILLGVAALVAIDSFAANVSRSVTEQSRTLLGGDLAMSSRQRFPAAADTIIDSLRASGAELARVTSFASMAVLPRTGATRLVQVRGVSANYPFYGTVVTAPANRWPMVARGANALVDPALLLALEAQIGDSITLGYGRFLIAGALTSVPGDPGVAAIIGPRVYIAERYLPETGLLALGSRAEFETLVRLPAGRNAHDAQVSVQSRLEKFRIRTKTSAENEASMTESIDRLSDFIGIVGLVALLLGGVGVASGVHAFVTRKIDTVAVLRCLGATSGQVLAVYVAQAAAMGLIGAAAGALLGVGIQLVLPRVIGDFLPVDVAVQVEPLAVLTGLGVGLWVALVFALRPLLALRHVSPLQALRRDDEPAAIRLHWRDWPGMLVNLLLVASVIGVALTRAPTPRDGVVLAAGIVGVVLVLWLSASSLSALARRLVRARWPFVVRQGVANLYRPANQTRTVVLSLGFGAFLVSTLYLVQSNLLRQFDVAAAGSAANIIFFDVQTAQAAAVDSIIRAAGQRVLQRAPLVTMRVAAINGRTVPELQKARGHSWAIGREYRSTYRDTLVASEKVTSGRWHGAPTTRRAPNDTLPAFSLERDVAAEMRAKVGDVVTWDVQGVPVAARLTSLRSVDWARFEPNFFAVFEPKALADAPQQFVVVAQVEGAAAIAAVQRDVVRQYPNVSSIDLSLILDTVGAIVTKVTLAVRFMALFSLAMGVPVLFSAVAAARRQRVREGVLLKTLGATRRQIAQVMLAEYAVLGVLGSLTGMVLSFAGAWGLVTYVFEGSFAPAWLPALGIAAAMVALTLSIGLLAGRDVFRETPMAALRES